MMRGAVISGMILASSAALARAQDTYGAIAISPSNGAYGYSFNFGDRYSAEAVALENCFGRARDCETATWFVNACGALSVGDGNGWGAHWGETIREAEVLAIGRCQTFGNSNCGIAVSLCSYE